MTDETKHSPILPLERKGCFVFNTGGPTESYSTIGSLCECVTSAFAELIVRRVNQGPTVDKKLAIAEEMAKAIVKTQRATDRLSKDSYASFAGVQAREFLKTNEG